MISLWYRLRGNIVIGGKLGPKNVFLPRFKLIISKERTTHAQIDVLIQSLKISRNLLQACTTCLDSNYRRERLDLCSEQMYIFEYLSLGMNYIYF